MIQSNEKTVGDRLATFIEHTGLNKAQFAKRADMDYAHLFRILKGEAEPGLDSIRKIRAHIGKNMGVTPRYIIPLEKTQIEKTSIGKIQRQKLAINLKDGVYEKLHQMIEPEVDSHSIKIPDWFFVKRWQPIRGFHLNTPSALDLDLQRHRNVVIFMDNSGVGDYLKEKLNESGVQCACIYAGQEFSRRGPENFTIRPDKKEDYINLVENSEISGLDCVIHLWSYGPVVPIRSASGLMAEQYRGCYSLLFFFNACQEKFLFQRGASTEKNMQPIAFFLVTSYVQQISENEVIRLGQSPLRGLMKSLPIDLPMVAARHIDFACEEDDGKLLLSEVTRPISSENEKDYNELVFRGGEAYVASLDKLEYINEQREKTLSSKSKKSFNITGLVSEGVHVIIGGLGAIGNYLAELLLEYPNNKVLLLGRKTLPDRNLWSSILTNKISPYKGIEAYLRLEEICKKSGSELRYHAVDINDQSKVKALFDDVCLRWNASLKNVFHLAGDVDTQKHWAEFEIHKVGNEQPEYFEDMFEAKVYGCWSLMEVMRSFPTSNFIAFSSIAAEFGGTSFSAYSAASSFMESCCSYFRAHGQTNSYCFNWSMWQGLGMNEHNPAYIQEAARERGHMFISPLDGWYALLLALSQKPDNTYIGLDKNNFHIRQKGSDSTEKLEATLFVNHTESMDSATLSNLINKIAQSLNCAVHLQRRDHIPFLETGEVDRVKLLGSSNIDDVEEKPAISHSEIKQKLLKIWKKITQVDVEDIHANLFELGGSSIIFAQYAAEIRKISGKEFSITDFYRFSSLYEIVNHLSPSQTSGEKTQVVPGSDRGNRRRALLRKVSRKR